jgi:peptidyl-prolyl cis-trans isomerase D
MITAFRRYLETWWVRGFFLIMVLAFISWGVGDVVRMIGTSTWAAKVGGQTIEGDQLQQAYQRDMAQVTRNLPSGQEPTQAVRSDVARQALDRLIAQAAMSQELQRLRVVTPDQAVRQAIFAIPAFRGSNGQFDQATFQAVLRNNGLTEPRFIEMMRSDLAQQQLLTAISAGAATPDVLLQPLFQGRFEKRSADMVEFPFAAAPACTDRCRVAALVRQSSRPVLVARISQDQGCRPVAADLGEGHPDHRCRSSGGLSAAQGAVCDAGQAHRRCHLDVR